ncbi:MAG: asparagine synthase (glutamine-hydrolyzing) [Defluviitaleaceae bacterium]|nr:asparagine synthase (glutamine-hydrolyzing) [Defluviitaleaceae bacterium]
MSGFCGFTGIGDEENIVIKNMVERIVHRGPYGADFYVADEISMAARIDFTGNEFLTITDAYVIVFDGELYNFAELKEEIEATGAKIETETEVLMHLFEKNGEEMLNLLRGPFAFLIYDRKNNEIFAARDSFGIKPLYYGVFGGEFLFSSEIKSFLDYPEFEKKLNRTALEQYLSFQYSVLDETFFSGVFKLPPAHFLRAKHAANSEGTSQEPHAPPQPGTDSAVKIEISRWWQATFSPDIGAIIDEEIEKIDEAVAESVKIHAEAEFPIGTLLSGGVDSSYITAASSKKIENAFTVGFENAGFCEIQQATAFCEEIGVVHIRKTISPEEFWEVLPDIQYYMDEPLADPAAVAQFFACELAKEYVPCVLSGEGADEFFGGYTIYHEPLSLAPITRLPPFLRKFICAFAKIMPNIKGKNYLIRASKEVEERFIGNAFIFSEDERKEILSYPTGAKISEVTAPIYHKVKSLDDVTKMQFLDLHLWLPGDILHNADRMAAANSITMRVPYLDKPVFEVASKLPTRFRVNKSTCKYAFRRAAARHFKGEKKRLGFPVPTREWLRQEKYAAIVRDAFNEEYMLKFFHVEKLQSLLDRHLRGKEDNSRKIWTVFSFALWYREFFS